MSQASRTHGYLSSIVPVIESAQRHGGSREELIEMTQRAIASLEAGDESSPVEAFAAIGAAIGAAQAMGDKGSLRFIRSLTDDLQEKARGDLLIALTRLLELIEK